GVLEFLGRLDDQVKVRGYRIELGEVENALSLLNGVKEAAVVALGDGEQERKLVAYVVDRAGPALSARQLREALKEKMPEYMIPGSYVFVEKLPLTLQGKVDRRTLAGFGSGPGQEEQMSRPPRTEVEELMRGIWQGVLGLESVGVEDDFFQLGGHSLLATQV